MWSSIRDHRVTIAWVIVLATAAALMIGASLSGQAELVVDWLRQITGGRAVSGPILFGAAFAIAMLALAPATPFQLASGVVFGVVIGTAVAFAATMVAAVISFVIARYLARDALRPLAERYPMFAAGEAALTGGSWKIVALLRLSLIVPFGAANYLFGLTQVSPRAYVLGSLAMLPANIAPVYLGHVSRSVATGRGEHDALEWTFLGIGALASIAASIWITRAAKAELAALRESRDDSAVVR